MFAPAVFRLSPRAPRSLSFTALTSLSRALSSNKTSFDAVEEFTQDFVNAVREVPTATDPHKSAALLRKLAKTEILSYTDMAEAPEKFFLAHRLLSTLGLGGFGVRFTVQFNLFAGSILGLGGGSQVKMLSDIQQSGELGCFLLTEKQAGVLSGLIVETTATWDQNSQTFVLNTPREAAAKNWISQGYTAELGVVIADLQIGDKSYGPHPFFMRLREKGSGQLLPGIRVVDMGAKTVANDLDNAQVWFDNVPLPHGALLDKFATVTDSGEYVTRGSEKMRIEVIGQRLLTGRQAIAEAALLSAKCLHLRTEAYAKTKICNGLTGERTLASLPHISTRLAEGHAALDEMLGFAAAVEKRLNACLSEGSIPPPDLVDAIAVLKVKGVQVAIDTANGLRQEVGSLGLLHGSGFELQDMLLCCKFAEGDSRILSLKLARDRLRRVQKDPAAALLGAAGFGPEAREARAALVLAAKLAPAGKDPAKLSEALDKHWREVYDLAELVCQRHLAHAAPASFVEGPCVDRHLPANTDFNANWKLEGLHTEARGDPRTLAA